MAKPTIVREGMFVKQQTERQRKEPWLHAGFFRLCPLLPARRKDGVKV